MLPTKYHGLGPGLLESVYEACLAHELAEDGLKVETQVILPVTYKNLTVMRGLKLDVLVENEIILLWLLFSFGLCHTVSVRSLTNQVYCCLPRHRRNQRCFAS